MLLKPLKKPPGGGLCDGNQCRMNEVGLDAHNPIITLLSSLARRSLEFEIYRFR